eukprot:m.244559 g.244559  ORF g.244559 m.244559 type:complete len:322 (-) comp14468_c0_seq1:309-1274(-)
MYGSTLQCNDNEISRKRHLETGHQDGSLGLRARGVAEHATGVVRDDRSAASEIPVAEDLQIRPARNLRPGSIEVGVDEACRGEEAVARGARADLGQPGCHVGGPGRDVGKLGRLADVRLGDAVVIQQHNLVRLGLGDKRSRCDVWERVVGEHARRRPDRAHTRLVCRRVPQRDEARPVCGTEVDEDALSVVRASVRPGIEIESRDRRARDMGAGKPVCQGIHVQPRRDSASGVTGDDDVSRAGETVVLHKIIDHRIEDVPAREIQAERVGGHDGPQARVEILRAVRNLHVRPIAKVGVVAAACIVQESKTLALREILAGSQ